MKTTTMLVEILIVGFCFFLSIIPVIFFVLGQSPDAVLALYVGVPLQFQLAAAYVAGVFWNRFCDQLFHKAEESIVIRAFGSRESYQAARIKVLLLGPSIRDYIGNQRSLIRVCRAAAVLFMVYCGALPAYFLEPVQIYALSSERKATIVISLVALLAMSLYAWYRLVRGYIAAISDAYVLVDRRGSPIVVADDVNDGEMEE